MNTAALRASVDNLLSVNMHALEHAKDKILMGAERKSAIISPETLRMTAYHEAGHALVALKSDGADPIHKATIMPRGRALGMVMQLPDGDQTSMSRKQMLARLDVCMGGRVAEELVYGALQVTSGAMGDLQQATRLARAMVMKYGLSDSLGMRFIDETEQKFLSPVLQQEIDQEVKALLESSYQRAKLILEKNRKELELIAQGLLEYESLSGGEIVDLLAGKKLKTGVKRSQRASRQSKELTAIHQAIGPNNAATSSGNTNTNTNHSNANGKPTETTSAATASNINNTNNNNTNNNSNNNNNNANAASSTSTSNSNTTNNSSSSSKIAVRGPPGKAASSS
jgi:ATP-dependent metalloprotease